MISLNPMIDCASDFGLLNYLFNAAWISATLAFRLSLECLIYQVNEWSCRALTSVGFFILSFVTPCASHTALTTNQNWCGSSFPNPLNTYNFIVLAILTRGGGGGGMGEDGGEAGGGVGRRVMHGNLYLIKLIALLGETFTSSSSSPHRRESKGLVSSFVPPLFL